MAKSLPPRFLAELQTKRAHVADARNALLIAEAVLRGWEDAAQLIEEEYRTSTEGLPTTTRAQQIIEAYRASGIPREGRGPSGHWSAIFAGTAAIYPRAATLDEIMEIAAGLGSPINRNTLRSQASIYADRGYLERIGQGAYRLTSEGAERFGAQLPQHDEAVVVQEQTEATPPDQESAAS